MSNSRRIHDGLAETRFAQVHPAKEASRHPPDVVPLLTPVTLRIVRTWTVTVYHPCVVVQVLGNEGSPSKRTLDGSPTMGCEACAAAIGCTVLAGTASAPVWFMFGDGMALSAVAALAVAMCMDRMSVLDVLESWCRVSAGGFAAFAPGPGRLSPDRRLCMRS